MSMWEQLDNINDFYKDEKANRRREALRILRKRIKRQPKPRGKRK